MIFLSTKNPECFLYRLKRARAHWELKKNVQFVVEKLSLDLTQWKNGESKDHYVETVILKKSMNIIPENMLE